jgi:hypothetical protein
MDLLKKIIKLKARVSRSLKKKPQVNPKGRGFMKWESSMIYTYIANLKTNKELAILERTAQHYYVPIPTNIGKDNGKNNENWDPHLCTQSCNIFSNHMLQIWFMKFFFSFFNTYLILFVKRCYFFSYIYFGHSYVVRNPISRTT